MGSQAVQGMLANAGAGGQAPLSADPALCARLYASGDVANAQALGCPPQGPVAGEEITGPEAGGDPNVGVPSAPVPPTVSDIGMMKAASPALAGTMTPPEAAGVASMQQTAPAAAAYQQPSILEMLKSLFGNMGR